MVGVPQIIRNYTSFESQGFGDPPFWGSYVFNPKIPKSPTDWCYLSGLVKGKMTGTHPDVKGKFMVSSFDFPNKT
jgi:hypothetical protein